MNAVYRDNQLLPTKLTIITMTTTVSNSSSGVHSSTIVGGADLRKLELLARAADEHRRTNVNINKNRKLPDAVANKVKLCLRGTKENPWVERYLPKTLSDHFVHKNKVAQFQGWINNTRGSKICLLTGGPGVGKTATVYLVAAESGFDVKEWVNPMSLTHYQTDGWKNSGDVIHSRPGIDLFTDFLLRSSQYLSLPLKGRGTPKKPLVLVEDFPNFFYTDIEILHQLIRNYKQVGECPLVFVMTDTLSSDSTSYKLFPKALLAEIDVQEIVFNPVAPSYMSKFVTCVLAQADTEASSEVVKEIVAVCGGDVRSVINNLQFRLQQSNETISKVTNRGPTYKKRKIDQSHNSKSSGPNEEVLFLFHAIGKVLYSKRNTSDVSEIETRELNGNLIKERRLHPLKEIPEQIGDKVSVAPETFLNFLAQNYLSFFSTIDDVMTASSFLSDATSVLSCWSLDDMAGSTGSYKNREAREEFGLSIAIRGLMFTNQMPISSTWKPLHKPKFNEVNTRRQEMIQNTHIFCNGPITQDYYIDLVPLSALIRGQKRITQEKRDFLREYGRFLMTKEKYNLLDEGDANGEDEIILNTLPQSIMKEIIMDRAAPEEEEFLIEEVPD